MNEQANTDLVKQCYEAYKKGDIQQLMSNFAPDVDWELPELEGVAFSGKRHGSDQVADFFQQMNDTQTAREFEPKDFVAQGDRVVVLGHYAWTVKATGEEFDSDWTHIFTIQDGKVTKFREFLDTHKAASAYQAQPGAAMRATEPGTQPGQPSVH